VWGGGLANKHLANPLQNGSWEKSTGITNTVVDGGGRVKKHYFFSMRHPHHPQTD